mmetsp:Transcript_6042/g.12307  ORF Transcript_6042/g.12307 Transcript_6042/m.12307 type:complete len:216 (+) Transcript_6042:1682-2329(+)
MATGADLFMMRTRTISPTCPEVSPLSTSRPQMILPSDACRRRQQTLTRTSNSLRRRSQLTYLPSSRTRTRTSLDRAPNKTRTSTNSNNFNSSTNTSTVAASTLQEPCSHRSRAYRAHSFMDCPLHSRICSTSKTKIRVSRAMQTFSRKMDILHIPEPTTVTVATMEAVEMEHSVPRDACDTQTVHTREAATWLQRRICRREGTVCMQAMMQWAWA